MVLTVTATGNHYFVDALAGVAAALAAVVLVAAWRRVRSRRLDDSTSGGELIYLPIRRAPQDARRAA
jgi:membrane-associated phospholipid phosphatase